jgi:hypothetical protein
MLLTRAETKTDIEFIKSAIKNRKSAKIYTYNTLSDVTLIKCLDGITTIVDHAQIDEDARNYLLKTAGHLRVGYQGSTGKFRRDYNLVRDGDMLYFTGNFTNDYGNRNEHSTRLCIKGNNAWIAEMFTDKMINSRSSFFPIYFFNEDLRIWCQLVRTGNNSMLEWKHIGQPPRPTGNFIGIGSDKLSSDSKLEIRIL